MSCDLLWEMDSQAWDWNSTETQGHHGSGYHLAKWVEEISRKWPWPRTWKWEWRWQQNQTTPHWQSCRSVSSYLPFARCSMELLLAATQKNGSCLLILLSFWVLHFHSHYITLRVLSFLVRGSEKRGGRKRKRKREKTEACFCKWWCCFAAVKVAAVPEALLTLLSRLCVGTLDLYIQACKKTNREIKTKERCGLTGRWLGGGRRLMRELWNLEDLFYYYYYFFVLF